MTRALTHLRLLADDMTGALDSAAGFVPAFGPLGLGARGGPKDSMVVCSATREVGEAAAAAAVAKLAEMLAPASGRLAFLKVDSLLRGHAGRELATVLWEQPFDHVLIAPAFPAQGRRFRNRRQCVLADGRWTAVGEDVAATLSAAGFAVHLRQPGDAIPRGISLFDSQTDDDLDAIAAAGLALPSALWVGSGGLAAALGRALGGGPARRAALPPPLLGLVGSHHAVMEAQLQAVAHLHLAIDPADALGVAMISDRVAARGCAFVTCAMPAGVPRDAARDRIAALFSDVSAQLPPPGTLFVSGGETLAGLLRPLGARTLTVTGEWRPGVPVARLDGGRWDGVTVLSKSGAFGEPDMLSTLVESIGAQQEFQSA